MPVIPVDGCGELGILRDVYSQELLPNGWTDGKNIRFREGYAEKNLGRVQVYGTPSVVPHFIMNILTSIGNKWIYAGLTKIYAVDSTSTHADITRAAGDYTGTIDNKWNGGVLEGIALMTNGVDQPQFWAGSGVCADLTNWPASTLCRVIRPFGQRGMALNITKTGTQYPHMVKWSHPAQPGALPISWDHTDATKQAGEWDLADDQTEIVDGLSLGDQFIVYKRGTYYAVQEIGVPYVLRFTKVPGANIGALATNCVVEFPGGHFVVGPGDVFVHQGGAPQSVIDAKNRKWLYRQIDSTKTNRVFATIKHQTNELLVCIPQLSDTECTLALVWNWKYQTWGVEEIPRCMHAGAGTVNYSAGLTWSTITDTWNSVQITWDQNESALGIQSTIFASVGDTKLYSVEVGTLYNGVAYESMVERHNIRFDEPNSVKLLKEVRPLIEGPVGSNVNIYVATAYNQTSSPTWHGPFPFTIGVSEKIDCHVTGRMFGVRFTATDDAFWRLKRYDLIVERIGLY